MPDPVRLKLTILIVEDDPMISLMISKILELNEYAVQTAPDGEEALIKIEKFIPDLVMLDINMPKMDGYEVCRRLKKDTRFDKIPILMITGNSDRVERLRGLEMGADDFLLKPFNYDELLTRVLSTFKRTKKDIDVNPLSGLPGTSTFEKIALSNIEQKKPFAALKADLNNFKAYNERYGFQRGDEVIRSVARLLQSAVEQGKDFVAHLGADDFFVLTSGGSEEILCQKIIERFDKLQAGLYDPEDARAGFIETVDRKGQRRNFPLITISVGCAADRGGLFDSVGMLQKICDEVLVLAKAQAGSAYRLDRRTNASPANPKP